MSEAQDKLEAAFVEGPTELAGLTLRPFSLGSLSAIRKLGLTVFLGEDSSEVAPEEMQRQLVTFAWMQSAPLARVLQAIRENRVAQEVDAFEFGLPLGAIPPLVEEIRRVAELAGAARVEVAPKPGEASGENPPPN